MKFCKKCNTNKDKKLFGILKSSKDGLYPKCKSCVKEDTFKQKESRVLYNKEYKLRDPEKAKRLRREWKLKDYNLNSKKYKDYSREWRKKNPLKAKERDVKNNNRKTKAMPLWITEEQILEINMIYLLAKSKTLAENIEYNVDHTIPLKGKTVCGLHVPWNLRVVTAKENKIKSNKIESEIN